MIKAVMRAFGLKAERQDTKEIAPLKVREMPKLKLVEGNSIFEDAFVKAERRQDKKAERRAARKQRRASRSKRKKSPALGAKPWAGL